MTTVEDVFDAAFTRVDANTDITWYKFQIPDDQVMDGDPYGVLSLLGPFETPHDNNILGIEDQPMEGTLLMSITAKTADIANLETANATTVLRGWAHTNTSALRTLPARGYEPVYSKFEPTLITRNVLFTFRTNL